MHKCVFKLVSQQAYTIHCRQHGKTLLEINAVCKCSFCGTNWVRKSGWGKWKQISQIYNANTMTILRSRSIVLFIHQTQVMYYFVWYYFKANLPLYGLGEALRVLDGSGSQIIWQSADEGEKVLSPVPRPPLPPLGNIPCTHFCEAGSAPWP